jgi:hypothetical protein
MGVAFSQILAGIPVMVGVATASTVIIVVAEVAH